MPLSIRFTGDPEYKTRMARPEFKHGGSLARAFEITGT